VPIPDVQTYSELVYSLQERSPSIQHSTLVLATIGPTLAKVVRRTPSEKDKSLWWATSCWMCGNSLTLMPGES